MKKLSRKLTMLLLVLALSFVVMPSVRVKAANSRIVRLDGTEVIASADTSDWTALYSAVNSALTVGNTPIAFFAGNDLYAVVHSGTVTTVSTAAATPASEITVLTTDDVTAKKCDFIGTGGSEKAVWYIQGTTLRIIGNDTITGGNAVLANASLRLSFVSSGYDVAWPSKIYSYTDGATTYKFFKDPEVGDEKNFSEPEYYEYEDPATKTGQPYMKTSIGDRASVDVKVGSNNPYIAMASDISSTAGWIDSAGTLTTVYIDDGISLAGNMNFLFNGNSVSTGTNISTHLSEVKDSKYTELKDVYLYCDTSGVEGCAGMFARCPKLENVYCATSGQFQNTRTTSYMFYGNEKLVNQTTPASLVDHVQPTSSPAPVLVDTSFMFADCSSIVHPDVASYDMSNVTNTTGMFYGAKKAALTSVPGSTDRWDISGWDLGNVVQAMFMFAGNLPQSSGSANLDNPMGQVDPGLGDVPEANTLVGDVDMSGWNLSKLLVAYMMFNQDSGITSVKFGTTSFSALIDASGMFLRCDNLQNVDMKNAQTPVLKNATSMFRMAGSKLTGGTADLSGWGASALTNTDLMFYGSGFQTVNLNSSTTMATVTSAVGMFGQMPMLKSLGSSNLSHIRFDALKNARLMFYGDRLLTALNVTDWGMANVEDFAHMFQDCASLSTGMDFSKWEAAKSIGSSTTYSMDFFLYNTAVTKVDLHLSYMRKMKSANMAFANNPLLQTVTLREKTASNDEFAKCETALGMFADNPQLSAVLNLQQGTKLQDARGMFANDPLLTSVSVKDLLQNNTTWASYMFKNDVALTSLDISEWTVPNVVYFQGVFDQCKQLATLTQADNITGGSNLKDLGTAFRNCNVLNDASVNNFLKGMSAASGVVDVYEMCLNDYALTKLDLSNMNFTSTTDYTRMAAMAENSAFKTNNLVTIIVPNSFLAASTGKNASGECVNIFWVDGDGDFDGGNEEDTDTDDLVTTFFMAGSPNANTLAYPYGGTSGDNDNRSFVKFNGRTINGENIGSYTLETKTDSATLAIDADSTLYTGGTTEATASKAPLKYAWDRNGTVVDGATSNTLVVTGSTAGDYVAHATPSILTGDASRLNVSFVIAAPVETLKAVYNGPEVTVGTTYSKDNVIVTAIDSGGNVHTLLPSDFTVDSQKVTKKGSNKFTAYYQTETGTLSATFTVPGVRRIGSISAEYAGPSVLVGKEYDPEYVVTTAYYVDDTKHKEGFEVEETSFSGKMVGKVGDNTYTVIYEDPDQEYKEFSDTIKVNGYKQINSISATYVGGKIKVGKQYAKSDVIVTLYYTDGSGSTKTTNFTLDSRTVTEVGENSFLATYRDPFGTTYTAGFTVPGYDDGETAASNEGQSTPAVTPAPVQEEEDPVLNSSVLSPADTEGTGSVGTYTGVVQTGRTERTVKLILIMVGIAAVIGAGLVYRHHLMKEQKNDKE